MTSTSDDVSPTLDLERPDRDRAALIFPDRTLAYGELSAHARALAAQIADARRIAIWAEPTIETAVAVTAALLAGIPAVPINPKAGEHELSHVLSDSAPEMLLTRPGVEPPGDHPRRLEIQLDSPPGTAGEVVAEDPSAPALVIYTSGTTGAPKGVVLPRRAVASNLDALSVAWGWTADDVVGHALPLFHVHGLVLGILGPLRRGGTAHHLGRFDVDAVSAALCESITMFFGVPTMYRRLAEAAEHDETVSAALRRPRLLVSGSAPLPAAEHERLERLTDQQVVERYGMTETLMITSVRADGARRAGYVGTALDGVSVRLVDDDGQPMEIEDDETIGEIQVTGPNVFLEYLNRPDATREAFADEWFRTGDLATIGADGYVRIVGRRATDLIKSGGYKIGAGEIEAALREHPSVVDAAVTGEPDDDLGERIVAWIVAAPGARPDADALSDHVARVLAPHKRPRVVHYLDELPRNEMGKVQKRRLDTT
jgi:malonyl-CoA/methylmalonyl-CoA synthetase